MYPISQFSLCRHHQTNEAENTRSKKIIFLWPPNFSPFYPADSDIDIAVILKDYNNLIDVLLDLMRLRRKIDSRIEPHPFREKDFEITNPIVNEIIKHGQDIKVNVAWLDKWLRQP